MQNPVYGYLSVNSTALNCTNRGNMDDALKRMQDENTKVFTDIDKEYIRKLQKEMYLCSAKCCDDRKGSIDDVQRCIKNCSSKLESAQEFIQGEVENFERRLQRCAMDCQDKARDKMMPNLSPAEQAVLKTEMESCVATCAENGIKSLPDLGKRLKQYLNNLK